MGWLLQQISYSDSSLSLTEMEANPQYKQDLKEYMWTEAKEQGQFSSTLESIALICLYSYIKLAIYLVFFFF